MSLRLITPTNPLRKDRSRLRGAVARLLRAHDNLEALRTSDCDYTLLKQAADSYDKAAVHARKVLKETR